MTIQKMTFFQYWKPFKKQDKSLIPKKFSLILTFYVPYGSIVSMPLATISAYIKQNLVNIEVNLITINTVIGGDEHTVEGYIKRVSELQPDLIAISCMSPHWLPLEPYLQAIEINLPNIPVLVGGYQSILAPEITIANSAVNYICVGDGEVPTAALIQRLRGETTETIPGLWEKTASGNIIKSAPMLNNNLSAIPYFDYSIFEENGSLRGLELSIFGQNELLVLPVITGRGCPYRCTYCSNSSLLKMWHGKDKYIRKSDPKLLIAELCRLRDLYEVDYFEFWDELFLSNIRFAYQFLELYKQHIHIPFSINSRVEKMDEKFCVIAKEAGCHTIWFGIESGSESYRMKTLGRKMTNEQIIIAAENAHKVGIFILTFNMIGLPFETREQMMETLELNRVIHPEFFVFWPYLPLIGTALYEMTKKAGLLLDDSIVGYNSGLETRTMSIKPHKDGATESEFREICILMEQLQQKNSKFYL